MTGSPVSGTAAGTATTAALEAAPDAHRSGRNPAESGAISRRCGFPPEDYPPFVGTCRIRPQLFHATSSFLDDPDLHVREVAISACIPLLDDPSLLHHRATLIPLLRESLAASAVWQYRERSIEALAAWGEDTTGLEGRHERFAFRDSHHGSSPWPGESLSGYDPDPPSDGPDRPSRRDHRVADVNGGINEAGQGHTRALLTGHAAPVHATKGSPRSNS